MLVLAHNKSSKLDVVIVTSILKKDFAIHNDVNKFRIDAREFLVTLLENISDTNPVPFNVVKYASVLDPKVLTW